jgi:hypothetical protein
LVSQVLFVRRIVAGGFPQFSAVLEVAAAIKGSGVPVIADGEFGIPVISQSNCCWR